MGIFRGLKAIEQQVNRKGRGQVFLKLNDGDQFRIKFLQELDESSPGFKKERGLGILVLEHSHPKDFRKRAVCTQDSEGRCWACEQRVINDDWRPRGKVYINVLVKNGDNEEVRVLNQGMGPRNVVQSLLESATEYGSITLYDYKIKRNGSGMSDTHYTLTVLPTADNGDEGEYQLHDLEALIHKVPYDKQEAFYNGSGEQDSSDDEW